MCVAAPAGIEVITCVSHTLYDTADICVKNGGRAPLTYKGFEKAIAALGPPAAPAPDPPARLPPFEPRTSTENDETAVPSLAELGYSAQATTVFKVVQRSYSKTAAPR